MRHRKLSRRKKTGRPKAKLIVTGILLLGFVVLLDIQIRPVVKVMAAYQAEVFASQAINDAVSKSMEELNVTYDLSLIHISLHTPWRTLWVLSTTHLTASPVR